METIYTPRIFPNIGSVLARDHTAAAQREAMGAALAVVTCSVDRDKSIQTNHTTGRWLEEIIGVNATTDDESVRHLAHSLPVDELRETFFKCAGPDERMDQDEFQRFVRLLNISETTAQKLWVMADTDRNGVIDANEIIHLLTAMTRARSQSRFCPTCDFRQSCEYCMSCKSCASCSLELFCPTHWALHPGRDYLRRPP